MPDGKRLWRTESGALVEDGHPDARFLAYGVDDDLPEGETVQPAKAVRKPANKQAARSADKAKG